MTPRLKQGLLGAALLATLVAAWYAPQDGGAGAVSAPAARAAAARKAPPPLQDVLPIRPRSGGDEEEEEGAPLFAAAGWQDAPPAAAAPQPVQQPVQQPAEVPAAPPLPFRVLGSYLQGGQTYVFLQYQDQNLVARVGDTLLDTYRVQSLEGSTMTLQYLPLAQTQVLEIGRTMREP